MALDFANHTTQTRVSSHTSHHCSSRRLMTEYVEMHKRRVIARNSTRLSTRQINWTVTFTHSSFIPLYHRQPESITVTMDLPLEQCSMFWQAGIALLGANLRELVLVWSKHTSLHSVLADVPDSDHPSRRTVPIDGKPHTVGDKLNKFAS